MGTSFSFRRKPQQRKTTKPPPASGLSHPQLGIDPWPPITAQCVFGLPPLVEEDFAPEDFVPIHVHSITGLQMQSVHFSHPFSQQSELAYVSLARQNGLSFSLLNGTQDNSEIDPFVITLWCILENPQHSEVIFWSEDGEHVVIKEFYEFSVQVLPKYDQIMSNLENFDSKMSNYGFHRIDLVTEKRAYYDYSPSWPGLKLVYWHRHFHRSHPERIHLVRIQQAVKINPSKYVAPFVMALWDVIEEKRCICNHLIVWSKSGKTFVITDIETFGGRVLPLYFGHDSITGFLKQLNAYGFHGVVEQGHTKIKENFVELWHPSFRQGSPEDLYRVVCLGSGDLLTIKQEKKKKRIHLVHPLKFVDIKDRANFYEISNLLKLVADNEAAKKHIEAYKRAIEENFTVLIRSVKLNHIGLPRSGKTTFRLRMMGKLFNILAAAEKREKAEPSTGIAEEGGQVIIRKSTSDVGIIQSSLWFLLKDEEAAVLGQFFQQVIENQSSLSDETETTTSSSLVSPSPISPSTPPSPSPISPSTPPSSDDKLSHPPESAVPEEVKDGAESLEGILSTICREDIKEGTLSVQNLEGDTILLTNTDTGGHAEFLDLQAALVQGPSLNLLYRRLIDNLDSEFEVYFTNEEGESSEKYDSVMTAGEVLFQSLSTIACYGDVFSEAEEPSSEAANASSSMPKKLSESKVLFIGTHRDLVSEEDFKEKDALLQKRVKATEFYKKDVIEFIAEDQLMFPVNNMSGDTEEIEEFRRILERVIEKNFKPIPIPATWLILSLYMRKKKLRTMSLEACEELAAKLGIGPDELQDALWFLHHCLGLLLYYPEVEELKGTVICDSQIVYDSTTNVIKNTFTFEKVGKCVSEKFSLKGQFSLKNVQEAAMRHLEDFLPLEKLIKLLGHISILTKLGDNFFMPCVLRNARASELQVQNITASDPAPLLLRYDCGYVPMGIFPALITNLVSQQLEDWEMIEEPLYKNRVQFYVGDDYDIITLIARPHYVEIAVTRGEDCALPLATLCARVRSVIQSTLSTVTSRMNYHFSMGYKFGFECPRHPGREHLCVLAKTTARRMECLANPRRKEPVPLDDRHKVWFSGVSPTSQVEQAPTRLTQQDLSSFCEKLHPYSHAWKSIAQGLGFYHNELLTIEASPRLLHDAPFSYLREMLAAWLEWAPGDARGSQGFASKEALRRAVDRAGYGLTAHEL